MKLKKNFLNLFLALAVLMGVVVMANSFVQAVPPKAHLLPSDYATTTTWNEAVKMDKPIAVNFYVDWCGYCKKFAPVLEGLRKEYKSKFSFVMVNAEAPANKKLVKDFEITGYPSFYLVDPKNDNRVFINQSLYSSPEKMRKELDRFIKVNK